MSSDDVLHEVHLRLAHAGLPYRDCVVWLSSPAEELGGDVPHVVALDGHPYRVQQAALAVTRRTPHPFQPHTLDADGECFVCDLSKGEGPHGDVDTTTATSRK